MKRFLQWLCLEDGDRIVRIKSLRPVICRNHWSGRRELLWPTLLVDRRGGRRETSQPVWDRVRFRQLFRGGHHGHV
jgi:hypothetical protein